MPTTDAHDPGTLCWIDLASSDAAGAAEFYCELFGWTAAPPIEGAGGYRMLLHRGLEVAGVAPCWGDTDPSTWSAYVASADASETCAEALASGGDVVMDAMDILTAGRMAVLRDPGGAQISVWEAGDHHGYQLHGEAGAPLHSELLTADLASSSSFYHAVFGWMPEPQQEPGYTVWQRRGEPVAAVFDLAEGATGATAAHWRVVIGTTDCDATARLCDALGGTVLSAPADAPPGRRALLEDPTGAPFAVVTQRS
jgi:predicted enzyme related to lactoylglutathione lyase